MSLRTLFVLVTLTFLAVPTHVFSQDEADSAEPKESSTEEAREDNPSIRTLSSMFSSLDTNGDRRLSGEEVDRLPAVLKTHFTRGRERESVVIDFEQFLGGIEELKKSTAQRYQNSRMEDEARKEQSERVKALFKEKMEAQRNVAQAAENAAPVRKARTVVAKPTGDAAKSFQVEVVMLRRTSDSLPKRTLASEVKSSIEGPGPSLAARLLPWLADPDHAGIHLIDYIQAQSTDGQSIVVQRGGREPYVSGTTTMGSRGGARAVSYSMHDVGTMVRVEPVASKEDGKLGLSVAFEKSYIDQPADDDDDDGDDDVATELPADAGEGAVPDADTGRVSGANSRARTAQPGVASFAYNQPSQSQPPAIATITAQGSLVQPAGEVGVLSEMAKKSGDSFEEVVILIQWN